MEITDQIRILTIYCSKTGPFVPRAAFCPSPSQRFQMTIISITFAGTIISRAVIRLSALQHLEKFKIAIYGSIRTGLLTPRAVIHLIPFEHFMITIFCSKGAGLFIPARGAMHSCPLQQFTVAIICIIDVGIFIPRTSIRLRPFEYIKVVILSSIGAGRSLYPKDSHSP